MSAVSPCVHPNCRQRDQDGNRPPIQEVMCLPCQGLLRQDLGEIVKDYVTLKWSLPAPARRGSPGLRHTAQQSFGHPAPDASDACMEIAGVLNNIEAQLRARVGDLPAPELVQTMVALLRVRTHEPLLVNHAFRYLSGHLEQLCAWPDVGSHAGALHETHQTNRSVYGLTRHVERLQLPCPDCDVAALVRDVARPRSADQPPPSRITCENCGRTLDEEENLSRSLMRIAWEMRMYQAQLAVADALG